MDRNEADRPAHETHDEEIEVTEEMLAAGCRELAYYRPREDDLETTVAMIYEAMIRAKEKRAHPPE